MHLAVHRDQLRELDVDRAAGKLAQADYEQARQELEKRLLQDLAGDGSRKKMSRIQAPAGREGYRPAAIGVLLLPLLAIGVYFAVGNPGAIGFPDTPAGVGITQQQDEN